MATVLPSTAASLLEAKNIKIKDEGIEIAGTTYKSLEIEENGRNRYISLNAANIGLYSKSTITKIKSILKDIISSSSIEAKDLENYSWSVDYKEIPTAGKVDQVINKISCLSTLASAREKVLFQEEPKSGILYPEFQATSDFPADTEKSFAGAFSNLMQLIGPKSASGQPFKSAHDDSLASASASYSTSSSSSSCLGLGNPGPGHSEDAENEDDEALDGNNSMISGEMQLNSSAPSSSSNQSSSLRTAPSAAPVPQAANIPNLSNEAAAGPLIQLQAPSTATTISSSSLTQPSMISSSSSSSSSLFGSQPFEASRRPLEASAALPSTIPHLPPPSSSVYFPPESDPDSLEPEKPEMPNSPKKKQNIKELTRNILKEERLKKNGAVKKNNPLSKDARAGSDSESDNESDGPSMIAYKNAQKHPALPSDKSSSKSDSESDSDSESGNESDGS